MTERTQGRVVNVWTTPAATTLKTAAAVGATVLTVDDASIFNDDGDGGSLLIGSQVTTYTTVDDDAGTVTIPSPGLTAAADADDPVSAWSELYGVIDDRQWASVQPEGKGDRADDIDAIVDDGIELVDGDRGKRGEACEVVRKTGSDTWVLKEVFGRPRKARGMKWESKEPHYQPNADEVTAATFTRKLLRDGIVGSHEFAVTVNGVDLGFEHYTVNAPSGAVKVTIPTWCTTADHFMFPPYAYQGGPSNSPVGSSAFGRVSYPSVVATEQPGQFGDYTTITRVSFEVGSGNTVHAMAVWRDLSTNAVSWGYPGNGSMPTWHSSSGSGAKSWGPLWHFAQYDFPGGIEYIGLQVVINNGPLPHLDPVYPFYTGLGAMGADVATTRPERGWFYFGEKVASLANSDADEPVGPMVIL